MLGGAARVNYPKGEILKQFKQEVDGINLQTLEFHNQSKFSDTRN